MMKFLPLVLAAGAAATPVARQSSDVANGFDDACADLAVIFARGTFDSGNIGPWVGAPFRDALAAKFTANSVAFQGVSADDYPADLDGYIEEGGSNSCATSLAAAVTKYSTRCPSSKIIISGWSQGALCAHKSFAPTGPLNDPVIRNKVIALTTFGDPVRVWQSSITFPFLPSNTKLLSYCQQTTPDPLCADVFEDFPHEPKAFIDRLKAIWSDFSTAGLNAQQKAAIGDIAINLPKQATKKIGKLGKDILSGHLDHWLLTPQHFLYGTGQNPMVVTAANDIFDVYQARK